MRPRSLILIMLLTTAACGDEDNGTGAARAAGPTLLPLDSVVLQETETVHIGKPSGIFVADDGSLFVADQFADRALHYAADGRFVKWFGGSGPGPGEFGSIGALILSDGSTVGFLDYDGRQITFFDQRSGAYVGDQSLVGLPTGGDLTGEVALIGNLDLEAGKSVALVEWPRTADSAKLGERPPARSTLVAIDSAYRVSDLLRGIFGIINVATWTDSIAVGFAASPFITIRERGSSTADTIWIPARRRRGIPADMLERMSFERSDYSEMVGMASALLGMRRAADGRIILTYYDSQRNEGLITSVVYVAVISPDRERACVDALLRAPEHEQPKIALRNDTLFVLERRLSEAADVSTILKSYRIRVDDCDWVPTTRAYHDEHA